MIASAHRMVACVIGAGILLSACTRSDGKHESEARDARARGSQASVAIPDRGTTTVYVVRDTTLVTTFDVTGAAQPVQEATLSTKIMGTVTEVVPHEGDLVATGAPLVRLDARDLSAKGEQAAAAVVAAEAMRTEAATTAARIRALYADSAATRAQLDAAETGLASADAGARTARAAANEVAAARSYAIVRAPFAGVVTRRFVDPGAFAMPGVPLLAVQDPSRLRLTASATPDAVRGLRRGATIPATIEGRPVVATIEGIIPAREGNLYTINALVVNTRREYLVGSAITLGLSRGTHRAVVVPASAVVHSGDLTGVTVRGPDGDMRRWIRLGPATGAYVEVTAGLHVGDRVVVPTMAAAQAPVLDSAVAPQPAVRPPTVTGKD